MVLNHDCVRSLLLWLETNQSVGPTGKPDSVMMRNIYGQFPDFSPAELNLAATYLVQKKLISLRSGMTVENAAPRAYVISGITAAGYDYLAAVKDDSVWKKIKEKIGSTALASVPNVIAVAAEIFASTI